jgi:hypothetical protein
VAAALATRVPSLERSVRVAVVVAEALVVVFVVVDVGLVLRADTADRPDSVITHFGYALAAVGLVPAIVWRAPTPAEEEHDATPEPVSLWVVVVALLAVAVCVVRLAQTR